jgi:hypothetical protein
LNQGLKNLRLAPAATAAVAEIIPAIAAAAAIATAAAITTATTVGTAAAVAATATTTTVATATATATTTTLFTGACFVDAQSTAVMIISIQGLNCGHRFAIGHFYKAKATKTTGVTIIDHCHGFHGAVRLKHIAYFLFCRLKRQIPYIYFL